MCGGAGAGKTTLLNALAAEIPDIDRVVTIEDAAELRLPGRHVVRLEARPASAEGSGEVRVRDLVRNALRMRPDRIVVGEVRAGEALDMLQAMNTGHEGSLSTCHANSPADALRRLETLVLMGDVALPLAAVREQVRSALDLVVQIARRPDGGRRVVAVAEVDGRGEAGDPLVARPLTDAGGRLVALPVRAGPVRGRHPAVTGMDRGAIVSPSLMVAVVVAAAVVSVRSAVGGVGPALDRGRTRRRVRGRRSPPVRSGRRSRGWWALSGPGSPVRSTSCPVARPGPVDAPIGRCPGCSIRSPANSGPGRRFRSRWARPRRPVPTSPTPAHGRRAAPAARPCTRWWRDGTAAARRRPGVWLGAALALAAEAGGSVASVLDGVTDTLRDRVALDREVAALSSQARASAAVLVVAPVAFAVLAAARRPAGRRRPARAAHPVGPA